ncbi:hypothetical protein GCM10009718_11840 [Isoptericola halotolerans]|uniref:DUF3618 domain-containing protein n=1 Tax=Isoptericola halotolerans TaxID=300560 RepID=A0ABX1ZZE5_9MICO|nr:DUF3618 domain-containing protein [Isoptericola halotolerans]NOV95895.1 hypothetical protein [Isoptericola halotolerans]
MSSDSTAPTSAGQEPAPSRAELEAQVRDARRELGTALDELTTRLSPSYQAAQLAHGTRQAATDVRGLFAGNGLPDHDARRSRNAKILLGVAAVGAAAVAVLVVRAVRR